MSTGATLVSVDLDDLACYRTIYGLPETTEDPALVLERCLPRFLDLFGELGVRATFFVIGRTVRADRSGRGREALQRAVREGHELGNHSDAHAYDLVRWSPSRMHADLLGCHETLEALGAEVHGFRAPGYCHDSTLLGEVARLGYRYDSSSLPSLPYYAAKRIMMAWLRWRGQASGSLDDGPAAFRGRHAPFVHPSGLLEIPISVTPMMGVPLIGTTLLCGQRPLSIWLSSVAARLDALHIELHGMDLVDPRSDPVPDALRPHLPELRVDLPTKIARLRSLLLRRHAFLRLCDWPSTTRPPRSGGS